jgi:hypothetical protein
MPEGDDDASVWVLEADDDENCNPEIYDSDQTEDDDARGGGGAGAGGIASGALDVAVGA